MADTSSLPSDPKLAIAALIAAVLVPTLPVLISRWRGGGNEDEPTPEPSHHRRRSSRPERYDGGSADVGQAGTLLRQLIDTQVQRAVAAEQRERALQDRLDQLEAEYYRARYELEQQLGWARNEADQLRGQMQALLTRGRGTP